MIATIDPIDHRIHTDQTRTDSGLPNVRRSRPWKIVDRIPRNDKTAEIELTKNTNLSCNVHDEVVNSSRSCRYDKNDKQTTIDDTHNVTQSLNRGYMVSLCDILCFLSFVDVGVLLFAFHLG